MRGARALILLLPVLLMAALAWPGACPAQSLRLVTGEWVPYCSSNPDEPGITTEIVLAAFGAVGVDTTLEFLPWPRCEQMIRTGAENVAAFPYVETPKRGRFALFSVPMLTERTYLYFANQTLPRFDFTGYEALRAYRVGTLNGFVHKELFQANGVPALVVRNTATGLKMLLRNRLDLFPINDLVAHRLMRRDFSSVSNQFGRSRTPMYKVALHLMVSRKNPRAERILSQFAEGMDRIRADGTFERIIARYE